MASARDLRQTMPTRCLICGAPMCWTEDAVTTTFLIVGWFCSKCVSETPAKAVLKVSQP